MAVLEGEGAAGVRMLVWGWCLARCRWGRFGAHEVSRIPKGALFSTQRWWEASGRDTEILKEIPAP